MLNVIFNGKRDFSSTFTIMQNGDNEYKAVWKELL